MISKKLASAEPDSKLLAFAARLCSLYLLLEDAPTDQVFLENLFLEASGSGRTTWKWDAGVNFFASAGDKRWWHDHRIPGGIAFSVNSVGHLVKSCQLVSAAKAYELSLDINLSDRPNAKLQNLDAALVMAMKSIENASLACAGKATRLTESHDDRKCPFDLPSQLQGKNRDEYIGYYHTDHTLPSIYFRPDVNRPDEVTPFVLDFTYLHTPGADNPAHSTMGRGVRIRKDDASPIEGKDQPRTKKLRVDAERLPIDQCPLLVKALAVHGLK